jgi:hypothetical protein
LKTENSCLPWFPVIKWSLEISFLRTGRWRIPVKKKIIFSWLRVLLFILAIGMSFWFRVVQGLVFELLSQVHGLY